MRLARTLWMWLAIAGAGAPALAAPAEKKPPVEKQPPEPGDKAGGPAAAREELPPEDVRKAEKLLDDLHDAVVKNQDACPKMATALGAVLTRHQDWLKQAAESGKDVPQATKDKLRKRQGEVIAGIRKCKDDKGVQGAKDRLLALVAPRRAEGGAGAAPPPKK